MMSPKKKSKSVRQKKSQNTDELLEAVKIYEAKISKENKQRHFDSAAVMGLLSEFFDSFLIVGYDLTGAAVKLSHSETAKDSDALSTLMADFCANKLNPGGDSDEEDS